mgnify:CR=1 FL=1
MTSRLQQTIQLQQKISPQQIQMIKLLELPTMQLEERIKREIEENIVLEEDAENKSEEDTPEKSTFVQERFVVTDLGSREKFCTNT